MLDFLRITESYPKNGVIKVEPDFDLVYTGSEDLLIRGGNFYAIWDEEAGLWSTREGTAIRLIDEEIKKYVESMPQTEYIVRPQYVKHTRNKMIDKFHKFVQKQMVDNYTSDTSLNHKVIFSNTETTRSDYRSIRLDYPLEKGNIDRYDELMSTLYSPSERHKIEWRIGSIIAGDSVHIQKFMVLYGGPGTGKSTVLNIIQELFGWKDGKSQGYCATFEARALGNSNDAFSLEPLKNNPLVAIQHDGDLSRIENNTKINSVVSHEYIPVNTKNHSIYVEKFRSFLFMGTNKPVKITDAKSGILRRLIDVSPTGKTIPNKRYNELIKRIKFEHGPIAYHCLQVYKEDPNLYDNYVPIGMMGASNDFYNFVLDNFDIFKEEDGTSLKSRWEAYKAYCDDAKVPYPLSQRIFKEELKNYFRTFEERRKVDGDTRIRNYYSGFRADKFTYEIGAEPKPREEDVSWIQLKSQPSIFDDICKDCYRQYASEDETPSKAWDNVTTTLFDLDTSKLHYVRVPENHIVIDFDIPDENGQKSLERNLKAAKSWPPTYAETSKSGKGIHLHYIYDGDVSKLSRVYDDHIEVKVYSGKSSLRRKLTRCNDISIAHMLPGGLPLKEVKKTIDFDQVKTERALRNRILKNLRKEYHPNTKPSVDFIGKILEDRYDSDLQYDVTDLYPSLLAFASKSTNNSKYCMDLVEKMPLVSRIPPPIKTYNKWADLIFFDVEVFINLFVVCWKKYGKNNPVVKMINPSKTDIEELLKHKLVGFNNRRYDNHILYARLLGYNNRQLYLQSQRIINGDKGAFFGGAYNISYADCYDYSNKKQSLKRFEIELDIHHQELGLPWDQPVPEDKWDLVREYCANDVVATEAVWDARQTDFTAREILADVAGLVVNDTTNTLTTKIIFGDNRKPQSQFNYRDMGDTSKINHFYRWDTQSQKFICYSANSMIDEDYTTFDEKGRPIYKGYLFVNGKSTYRGEEVGEGGYVYAEPDIYHNVSLLDISSMHPSSIVAENLFGDTYTQRFKDLLDIRIRVKHKEFDRAKKMLGGALAKYFEDEDQAKDLAQALKIPINSVYGLTSARFENPFKDPRNVDNIVAKRGRLFMINLKHEVQKQGFTVRHIKTDSIKIPNATPEIINFVMEYGKLYGYNFEHERTYDRMCLVNDAVYIAKYKDGDWTATGTQFQVPYVFKTLFSHEPIEFRDMCETKSVQTQIYLDMNENLPNGEHNYIYIGKVGSFCPILPGKGGGVLYRENNGKYYAVTGTKGYRWLEAEQVRLLGVQDNIDKTYYTKLVDEAVDTISKYGSFEDFIS